MSDYRECPGCKKQLKKLTSEPEKYRKHTVMGRPEPCDFAGTVVVKEEECQPESKSSAPSPTATSAASPEDVVTTAKDATNSTPSSPTSPDTAADVSTASPAALDALPGVNEYVTVLDAMSTEQLARYRASVDAAARTPFSQPLPVEVEQPPLFSQPAADSMADPASVPFFSQPAGRRSEAPTPPMSAEAGELAARLKELFRQYDQRRSADNRSAQTTMGPSEMGYGCDRRIALSLLRQPPVNPGGDGWAAWVGTCIHAGLEDLFRWADGNTGRFVTEDHLEFESKYVPKGTADLLDRTLLMLADHKCLGRWSRNKFKASGPPPHYRIQGHVYAHGARRRGEKIDKVAWFLWPRDEASLDDLYVYVEDYNPALVVKAFDRVDRIGQEVEIRRDQLRSEYPESPDWEVGARIGLEYTIDSESCRYCPFHLPGSQDPMRGCNGKG